MNKKELLDLIKKLQFYLVDLNLYLDNFPDCTKASEDYELISSKLQKILCEYEEHFGPLTNFGSAYFQNPDKWINSPWPWERQ